MQKVMQKVIMQKVMQKKVRQNTFSGKSHAKGHAKNIFDSAKIIEIKQFEEDQISNFSSTMVKRFGNCTSEMIELSNDLKAVLLPSHVCGLSK